MCYIFFNLPDTSIFAEAGLYGLSSQQAMKGQYIYTSLFYLEYIIIFLHYLFFLFDMRQALVMVARVANLSETERGMFG